METDFAERDQLGGLPESPRWAPDGQRIAFLRSYCAHCPHRLFLKNAAGDAEVPLGDVCGGSPSWTPDGQAIITAEPVGDEEDCRLVLIPADGSRRTVLMEHEGNVAAVSPDGKRLLYAANHVMKLAQLTSDFRLAGPAIAVASEPHAIKSINWAPDGHAAVFQRWAGQPVLLPMDGPILSPKLFRIDEDISISQILPDGSGLGVETIEPAALWRIDLKENSEEKILPVRWTDQDLVVSPKGDLLAFMTTRDGPTQLWISKVDGGEARVLISIPPFSEYGDNTVAGDLSWSPDGQWIAFLTSPGVGHGVVDAKLFLIPAAGGPLRQLLECSMDGSAVRWSADSRSVFVAKEERTEADFRRTIFRSIFLPAKKLPWRSQLGPPSMIVCPRVPRILTWRKMGGISTL
jgi:Tol biopolymer transport system component